MKSLMLVKKSIWIGGIDMDIFTIVGTVVLGLGMFISIIIGIFMSFAEEN